MAEQSAYGTILKINTGSLTLVTSVEEVSFPVTSKITEEVTSHDSTGGWYESIAIGVYRAEPFDALLTWDESQATHAQFRTSFNADAPVGFSVEDPGGAEVMAFSAHVMSIARLTPLKGALRARIRIEPTGAVTIT